MKAFALLSLALAALLVLQAQTTSSIWDGVYTADQAKRGADRYTDTCASCHGDNLEGEGQAPPLMGKEFTDNWNKQTVGDLFDIVKGTMPADKPGSLTRQQNSEVLAYIFQKNGYPAGKTELSAEPAELKKIRIEAKN